MHISSFCAHTLYTLQHFAREICVSRSSIKHATPLCDIVFAAIQFEKLPTRNFQLPRGYKIARASKNFCTYIYTVYEVSKPQNFVSLCTDILDSRFTLYHSLSPKL